MMRPRRCTFVLTVALMCSLTAGARGEVHVEGSLTAVRVTTDRDPISEVLSAFAATFSVKYRTAVPLDARASATYTGSFAYVISRLLDGYNYVVKKDYETTEIIVLGRRGEIAVPPPLPKGAPSEGILSRWR